MIQSTFTVRVRAPRLSSQELNKIAQDLAIAVGQGTKTRTVTVFDQTGKAVAYWWSQDDEDARRQRESVLATEIEI